MRKAVGFVELKSIPVGIQTADEMVKAGNVELLLATPICPGKYVIIIGGHVGPVKAAMSKAELVSGMLITDEPGVYVENKYGIRTENTLLVREYMSNEDGDFLCFENLTFVPIDMELVDMSLLNPDELEMLRHYQQEVYDKLKDYLDMEELDYVKRQIP